MPGIQDFIGYDGRTFGYLRRTYGEQVVFDYWGKCIAFDSQRHARQLFLEAGACPHADGPGGFSLAMDPPT